ncbi:MAG: CocE/NonD family hydrolase [Terriglobia bacterium]
MNKLAFLLAMALLSACVPIAGAKSPNIRWQFNVPVRMRDGVILAANVFLPEQRGRYPVLLDRTPYGKSGATRSEGIYFAQRGYAVVIEDTRGRYDSDGTWYAFSHEAGDGQDTIAWAARQPWSNGRVVTMGASYNAMDQWLAATPNPALVAMITGFCPSDLYLTGAYPGGAFKLGVFLPWSVATGRRVLSGDTGLIQWPQVVRHLPVITAAEAAGYEQPFYRDWLNHPARGAYWQALSWQNTFRKLNIPVFLYGGWYDLFQQGTIEDFLKIDHQAGARARAGERLIEGPWGHGLYGPKIGDKDFGNKIVVDIRAKELRWLDHYVRGKSNGADRDVRVNLFVMGRDEWESVPDWPPASARPTRYFLHSGGRANMRSGDGSLDLSPPGKEHPDRFEYDPANPVPAHGGGNSPRLIAGIWGVMDQRPIEARRDVLVYTTPPQQQDLEAAGSVEVHLFASSSARDTDWTAKLVDVAPNGFAMNLTDGILRARYRTSWSHPQPLTPGKIYEFRIEAGFTDDVFLKGHRLRLEISSSNFPTFSRNTNTGNEPEKDTHFIKALQTVYHDAVHSSYVRLPLVPAEPAGAISR